VKNKFLLWRRSFDVPPPPTPPDSNYDFSKDQLYVDVPCALIPKSECLKDVVARVMPYFEETIAPRLLKGDNVVVVAHGNSLRAVIMELEKIPETEISNFELPTGTPRLYRFNSDFSLASAKYIEDPELVEKRALAVKNQVSKG
jgi:2,3-bisphosphoglycerate-dependent phosphoglycerate mutase